MGKETGFESEQAMHKFVENAVPTVWSISKWHRLGVLKENISGQTQKECAKSGY